MRFNSEVVQKITRCSCVFVRETHAMLIRVVLILLMLPIAFNVFAENANTSSPESERFDPDAIQLVDKKLLMSYLADHSRLLLIDARSSAEFKQSHIEGAINLPIEAYRANPNEIEAYKSSKIIIYCRSGKRASTLARVLKKDGFTDVQVLPSRQIFSSDNLMVFNCGIEEKNDTDNK